MILKGSFSWQEIAYDEIQNIYSNQVYKLQKCKKYPRIYLSVVSKLCMLKCKMEASFISFPIATLSLKVHPDQTVLLQFAVSW